MSATSTGLTPQLRDYLVLHGVREHPALAKLREITVALPMARMQICPEQGALLQMLAQILGAKKCLEIGTFTGYSALAVALALPADGKLIACDINKEWTDVGRPFWEEAGVAERIDLRLAPALETLDELLASGHEGTFDLSFIDADKSSYMSYYERSLALLRPGGIIAVDNVLWDGSVIDPTNQSVDTVAIHELNTFIIKDPRVEPCMIPIGDGLTLARKV